MPLTASAKKALKVDKRRKLENDQVKAKIKSAYKGAKIAIAEGSKDLSQVISKLYREVDLAAKKHVIHKNKASRLKSKITIASTKK